MTLAFTFAAAVLSIGLLFLYAVAADARSAALRADCASDGVAITSEDRLRMEVISLDRTMLAGRDASGRRMDMEQTTAAADVFARQQVSPDVTLAMLEQCASYLSRDYAFGYWLVSAALVRESARRRMMQ